MSVFRSGVWDRGSPTEHRCGVAEKTHADERNDGADQRQPLKALCNVGVARQPYVSSQTDEPHAGATPEANDQPGHCSVSALAITESKLGLAITAVSAAGPSRR